MTRSHMKRPDMRAYFTARIDHHVNGMMSRTNARLPHDVVRVTGDVDDTKIVVLMRDNTVHLWTGGRYASRKVNGTYAPLMPKPVTGCKLESSYGTGNPTTYCERTALKDDWCAEHLFEWGRITEAEYLDAPRTSRDTEHAGA